MFWLTEKVYILNLTNLNKRCYNLNKDYKILLFAFIIILIFYFVIKITNAAIEVKDYTNQQTPAVTPVIASIAPGMQMIESKNIGPGAIPKIQTENDFIKVIIRLKHPPLTIDSSLSNQQALEQEQNNIENIIRNNFGARITARWSTVFNGLAAEIKKEDFSKIESLNGVDKVSLDKPVYALLPESVPLINAPLVWAQLDSQGFNITGRNIKVAVIDTGVDYTHPDLGGCFGPSCKVIGGYDFANNDPDPMDDFGHGTHVAGIIAANGSLMGVAPGSKILAYKVLDSGGGGFFSWMISGIDRAVQDGAHIISMSLGGYGYSDDDGASAVDNAANAGVVVVISAGNSGPGSVNPICRHNVFPNQPFGYFSICSPGASLKSITVAASTKQDILASFSSRGYALYSNNSISALKPDVTAPGVSIISTVPTGSCSLCDPSGYLTLSGTSMAAPHISGVAALLKQAHPLWTQSDIKLAITNPSISLWDPSTFPLHLDFSPLDQGTGRVDAYRSYMIRTFFSPNNKFLGQVLPNQTFQSSTSFQLKNIYTQPQSYSLAVSADSPAIASINPTTVSLNPGQSTPVTLSYIFDPSLANTAVFYNGNISIQNQGIRIPFSTFKVNYTGQSFLTLNFGPYHYYTFIFDLLPTPNIYSETGLGNLLYIIYTDTPGPAPSYYSLYLPNDTDYYLSSTFARHPSWFSLSPTYYGYPYSTIFNNIHLTNSTTINLDRNQANRILNYTILDQNGNPLLPSAYCHYNWNTTCNRGGTIFLFMLNRSTGLGVGYIAFQSALLQFINDAPLWSVLSTHTFSTPEPATYVARHFIKPVVGSHTITLQPSTKLAVKYKFIQPYNTLTSMFWQNWAYFNHTQFWLIEDMAIPRVVGPNTSGKDYESFYFTPESALTPGGSNTETVANRLSRVDTFNQFPYTLLDQTPYLRIPLQNIVEHIIPDLPWISLNTINVLYNSIYESERSPNIWNTKFVNNLNNIRLKTYHGFGVDTVLTNLPLIKQNNILQAYGIMNPTSMAYSLVPIGGGTPSQGTISSPTGSYTSPYLTIPVSPGAYALTVNLNGYDWINGTPGNFSIVSIFDTTYADNNPPVIDFFRILADSSYTGNILPLSANNKIIFKAKDLETSVSDQKLYIQLFGSIGWLQLPITIGADYDFVVLPNLPVGDYSLMYYVADSLNNSIEQVQSPAFRISLSAAPPSLNPGPATCNNNNICESSLGENPTSCPQDCAPPQLISLNPNLVNNNIDNTVQLVGSNFVPGAIVNLNGQPWNPSLVFYNNAQSISVLIPKCTLPAIYSVSVKNPSNLISGSLPLTVYPKTTINMPSTVSIGSVLNMNLLNSCNPNKPYILILSFGTSGVPLPAPAGYPSLVLPLSADELFFASIQPPYLGLVSSIGALNANGQATVSLPIPNIPILVGFNIKTAFITTNPTMFVAIAVSDSYSFTIT